MVRLHGMPSRSSPGRSGFKLRGAGISRAPVITSIALAEDSKVLKDSLGDHVHEFLISNKKADWDSFKSYVSPYELERYLPIL